MVMDTYILALETSSARCSVGLLSSDGVQTHCLVRSHEGVADHTEKLLPMVDDLLAAASASRDALAAIAFGQGPGAFTGLRVACGLAQGMALGLGVPVIPVPSLLAVAAQAQAAISSSTHGVAASGVHVVLQDARMDEAYAAIYQAPRAAQQAWQTLQEPMLIDRSQLAAWLGQWLVMQSAPVQRVWLSGDLSTRPDTTDALRALAPDTIAVVSTPVDGWVPDACVLAGLAWQAWCRNETVAPENAMPLYVRDKVAFTIDERERGAGGNPRAVGLPDSIHPMLPVHVEAVAAIEARVQSFPWSLKNFQDSLDHGYPAWVSMHHGQVTGYAIVMMAPDVAHLLVIGVHPDHQGRGTGRMLLEHCESQAAQNGSSVMVLEVRQSNHQALGFYRHMGYEEFSVRKDYYPAGHGQRENASAMKKPLSERVAS